MLALAAEQDRILVSHDFQTMPRHFGEFLGTRGSSPGVFLVKQSSPVGEVIDELVLILGGLGCEGVEGSDFGDSPLAHSGRRSSSSKTLGLTVNRKSARACFQ